MSQRQTLIYPQRYDLSTLLRIIGYIDISTTDKYINAANMQNLKQHRMLCEILEREEYERERMVLSVNTDAIHPVTTMPLRLPVSRFARGMWPPERGVSAESVNRMVGTEMDEERRSIGGEVASQALRFESSRERQLYYRPREWRQRKRGKWQNTGLYVYD